MKEEKLNEEAAPNLNLGAHVTVRNFEHEFSEELSDGGERNQNIEQLNTNKK
ncbi:hypothetical protein [Bacillus massilinigeriensis]|uniref:hypothetical protein n=1 Tax=Bacillus massilionigeriensis TaxID=1805475 RepID=UPI00156D72A7|nr:hypothetical protein [Bacillus massilionigeriensis]